jgi:hypothetical protein
VYYVALQALGDNLISISLLSQLDKKIQLLGTKHTENIVRLMEQEEKFEIKIVFDDIPAFYDIRKRGIVRAIKDICKFRKYVKQHKIKELVFEKKDFRIKLLTLGLKINSYSASEFTNVYYNRGHLIQEAYQGKVKIDNLLDYSKNDRIVLISPVTRIKKKDITTEELNIILAVLKKRGFTIQLLDYSKEYKRFADQVDEYITDTTLNDVKHLIRSCDLYLGADSFLVHLAYFFKKPYFIVFNIENKTFLPPASEVADNYIVVDKSIDLSTQFEGKLVGLGL